MCARARVAKVFKQILFKITCAQRVNESQVKRVGERERERVCVSDCMRARERWYEIRPCTASSCKITYTLRVSESQIVKEGECETKGMNMCARARDSENDNELCARARVAKVFK
jgi:hypothetical protein